MGTETIRVLIIEGEAPASENLVALLGQTDPAIQIAGITQSIRESVRWLELNPPPALIFMDIQLNDGLAFTIFEKVSTNAPVIFTTYFDGYMLEAFKHNGIDYLLKPLNRSAVEKVLTKYKKLLMHFRSKNLALYGQLEQPRAKNRILVKSNAEIRIIRQDDVVCFIIENTIVFVVTKENKKYATGKRLRELEAELNPDIFFRANRKVIINIDHITKMTALETSQLQVELSIPLLHPIIISTENATSFKSWLTKH